MESDRKEEKEAEKQKGGKGSGKGGKSSAKAPWHPTCARCSGRHQAELSCPNTVALTAGFDANKTPGILFDFFDNYRNCQCKGRGHLKAHHAQALSDYLAKKGSVRPGGKGSGKGAPKETTGKSKGGKRKWQR